jgi:hypothetical protein
LLVDRFDGDATVKWSLVGRSSSMRRPAARLVLQFGRPLNIGEGEENVIESDTADERAIVFCAAKVQLSSGGNAVS